MHKVVKSYRDLPAAHRQPNHDGHCKLIHGHNWQFDIMFACTKLDDNGFVIDVGKLQMVKDFLTQHFDHTLLINGDDPEMHNYLRELDKSGLAKVVIVDNCGMEGLSKFVFDRVNHLLGKEGEYLDRNVQVLEVVCWEDSKNSCIYHPDEIVVADEPSRDDEH